MEGIKTLMPGIKVRDWNYDSISKRKVRRSNHEPALIKFFETMDIGRVASSRLKNLLGIPDTTFERIVAKMKDKTTELYKAMKKLKVVYKPSGKGQRSYLIKERIQGSTPT